MQCDIKDAIQETCGWIGCVMNVYFYILPIMPFINVIKGKINFEESPGLFVTISYVNCLCWYIYGELTFSDQMRLSYIIGSLIYLILFFIYLFYEIRKYIFDTILNILLIGTGTYSVYVGLIIIFDDDQIAAKFCNVTSLASFYFPSEIIYKVIKDKNYNIISVKNNWINVATSFCWLVYGVLILENLMVYPHVINIILSLVQIYLYKNYKKKFPNISEKDNNNTLDIETVGNEDTKLEEAKIKNDDNDNDSNIKERPVKIVDKEN